MTFTLINARLSPFGRKIAIALIEKGLDFTVVYDVPWGESTITPEYSPLEQLPILISADGEKVYDSTFILEWLEARHPDPALLPADADARLEAKKRQMLGERVMEIAQALIFETLRPAPSQPWIDRQTRKILSGLSELDRIYASETKENRMTPDVGDIAVFTALDVFEFAAEQGFSPPIDALVWRERYPALTQYFALMASRPSFLQTRPQLMDVNLAATVA
ncbi:MAG: glutathione S-transferase N-terminal domain-containing protein [Blastomonas fulva]|uniref:glutathione S-transferase N-terminal domain-containing protein n=1 Tax=Blastomonas fulva TaxID=1550728 RepID=UPI004033439F